MTNFPKVELPEKFEPTDWDKIMAHIVGFDVWQEKQNKKRQLIIKQNHDKKINS